MISTRQLDLLPDVERLQRLWQSLALLDAILAPDWESRYYSFDSKWSSGEQMGSMENGGGDDLFALFNTAGCFLKGFAHEAAMAPRRRKPPRVWLGVLDAVPPEFSECLQEPAFTMQDTTFCIWRRRGDAAWQMGTIHFPDKPDPDGSESLLSIFDGDPVTYQQWAEDYYETELDLAAIEAIYQHLPLTKALTEQINPDASLEKLKADIQQIGYAGNGPH